MVCTTLFVYLIINLFIFNLATYNAYIFDFGRKTFLSTIFTANKNCSNTNLITVPIGNNGIKKFKKVF